jgi:lipopolysaccharide/colanic/teichoic acid biosynthesis glycosyltransferase
MYRRCGKRLLDIAVAAVALIALAPLIALVALLVRRWLGAPVIFAQQRLGLDGRPFAVRKFRTMTDARDAAGSLLPDAERLTSFGIFLRATSLDELPELANVLRGEMSIVGPRPLHIHYAERYTPEQMRRHAVRPGITGWAQVNGRNALGWEERFAHDVWYVDHCSLWLDLRIIARTVRTVLRRTGITQAGHATMSEFGGSLPHTDSEIAA